MALIQLWSIVRPLLLLHLVQVLGAEQVASLQSWSHVGTIMKTKNNITAVRQVIAHFFAGRLRIVQIITAINAIGAMSIAKKASKNIE